MGLGKIFLGVGGAIGAIVLAPVALPAMAATAVGTAAIGAATAVGTAAVGAATAIGTAAAATTVGTAAVGAMTAVGAGVGAAAGAVGLGAVATVTSTAAGAAAVGTIATSAAVGASTAISGANKNKEATDILDSADDIQRNAKKKLDNKEKNMNSQLKQLGKCKVAIWKELDDYIKTCSKIRNIPEKGDLALDKEICFDKLELAQIQGMTLSLKDILTGSVASLTGGQLIGLATSTGFTSIATASTGTAIAGLHGIAATNASLAALGGGAMSAGGLGMAGGAVVANALAFAPVIAIGGWFISRKGSKNLKNAENVKHEVDLYADEVNNACEEMNKLEELCIKMRECLEKIAPAFTDNLNWLKDLVVVTTDFRGFDIKQQRKFFITFKIAKILTDLTCTQLIDAKTNQIETANINKEIEEQNNEYSKITDENIA